MVEFLCQLQYMCWPTKRALFLKFKLSSVHKWKMIVLYYYDDINSLNVDNDRQTQFVKLIKNKSPSWRNTTSLLADLFTLFFLLY